MKGEAGEMNSFARLRVTVRFGGELAFAPAGLTSKRLRCSWRQAVSSFWVTG